MIAIISRIIMTRDILSSCLHNELKYITGNSKLKPQKSIQRRTLADKVYEDEEEVISDVFDDYISPDMLADESSHGAPPLYKAGPACRCCKCSRALSRLLAQDTVLNECEQRSEELTEVITENVQFEKIVSDSNFQPEFINIDSDTNKSYDGEDMIVKTGDDLKKDDDTESDSITQN